MGTYVTKMPQPQKAVAKLVLAAGVLLAAQGAVSVASAQSPVEIITQGTISAGTDSANLLGQGTNLAGDSYKLQVYYPAPDSNLYTSPGTFGIDIGNTGLPAAITLTVGTSVFNETFTQNYGASITLSNSSLTAAISGVDAAGNTATAGQNVYAATNFITSPDLQSLVGLYSLGGGDSGTDTFTWNNAAYTESITLTGTTSSVIYDVPEPTSLALLAMGGVGLLLARRRQSAA